MRLRTPAVRGSVHGIREESGFKADQLPGIEQHTELRDSGSVSWFAVNLQNISARTITHTGLDSTRGTKRTTNPNRISSGRQQHLATGPG